MNPAPLATTEPPLRRLVLALTRRELPATIVDVLLRALAPHAALELRAVFIEDLDLLNAVALPFTSEWCRLTNALRPIDRAHLEAHFARESAAAAAGVAALSHELGRTWQFEVLRASKAGALRATLAESDALLLPGKRLAAAPTRAPVLAVVEGGDGARCRALAEQLARATARPLEVLVVENDAALDRAAGRHAITRQLARADVALVLLSAPLLALLGQDADELDERCPAPLLLVR
ncbi:MAG: hypothetical protein AB7I01_13555 [Gammaproteobacteria bacterium]